MSDRLIRLQKLTANGNVSERQLLRECRPFLVYCMGVKRTGALDLIQRLDSALAAPEHAAHIEGTTARSTYVNLSPSVSPQAPTGEDKVTKALDDWLDSPYPLRHLRDSVLTEEEATRTESLHQCRCCGTYWRLWHGNGWSLADANQRPLKCCDNSADFLAKLVPAPELEQEPTAAGADWVRVLSELEAKATPGPWRVYNLHRVSAGGITSPLMSYLYGPLDDDKRCVSLGSENKADHELVAALRNAWPQIKAALSAAPRPDAGEGLVKRLRETAHDSGYYSIMTEAADALEAARALGREEK